jgi:hypothetical protein
VPWLRQYYTNAANLAELMELDNANLDSDPMLNWQEYWSKTDPTDSNKFLRFTAIQGASDSTGSVVRWTSETSVVYRLTRSTNLVTDMFTTLVLLNNPATPPINTDLHGTEITPKFHGVAIYSANTFLPIVHDDVVAAVWKVN